MADKIAELNIKRKRVDELIPHELNPRFHPNSQIDKIVEWLSKVGYYKSIVVQKGTNKILAGHGVLAGLIADGYTHVDVNEVDQPDKWAMALLAWDNKSGELSSWDQVNLIALEAELGDMEVEMEELGFEMGEVDIYTYKPAGDEQEKGVPDNQLWEDMPEFEQEDAEVYQKIIVRFKTAEDVESFAKQINRKITPETKYLNFPKTDELGYDKGIKYAS